MHKIISITTVAVLLLTAASLQGWGQGQNAKALRTAMIIQNSRNVAFLASVLEDPAHHPGDPANREWAITSLANVGTPEATDVLAANIGYVPDHADSTDTGGYPNFLNSSRYYPAVRGLMQIGPTVIPSVLHQLLTGQDTDVFPCVIFLVEEMPKLEVRTALQHLLSTSPAAQKRIEQALADVSKCRRDSSDRLATGAPIKRCPDLQGAYIAPDGAALVSARTIAAVLGVGVKTTPTGATLTGTGPNPKSLTFKYGSKVTAGPEALQLPAGPFFRVEDNQDVPYVPFGIVADYFGSKGKSFPELQAEWGE